MQYATSFVAVTIVPMLQALRGHLADELMMRNYLLYVDGCVLLLLAAITVYVWFWLLDHVRELSVKLMIILLLLYAAVVASYVTLGLLYFFAAQHPDVFNAVSATFAQQTAGLFAWPAKE